MRRLLSGTVAFVFLLTTAVPGFAADVLRQAAVVESAAGLEELEKRLRIAALVPAAPELPEISASATLSPAGGLEELTASRLIHDWNDPTLGLTLQDKNRVRAELSRVVDKATLRRLVRGAKRLVNPPATLYQLVAQVLKRPQSEVQALVESLGPEAFLPPADPIRIGDSVSVPWEASVVKGELENNIITIGGGGGGRRFKGSLTPVYRAQQERLDHFEKPLAMIGPSGTSPIVNALEQLSELARRVDARGVEVVVVTGEESHAAIKKDIAQNGKRLNRRRLSIRVVKQDAFPGFHEKSKKILTTRSVDPTVAQPDLRKNPNGTYGIFSAAYKEGQRRGFGKGKGMLVLYGDDPILNTVEFIARVLSESRSLDVATVVTQKRTRQFPVGGTAVDLQIPGGPRIPLIIEEVERKPNPDKGIPGLPAFNEAEEAASSRGRNAYGFNTGVLKLSARGAREAAKLEKKLKFRYAIRDGVLQLELFLTHIPTLVGFLPNIKNGTLFVDYEQYLAAKNMAAVARDVVAQNGRDRKILAAVPGGERLVLHPDAFLDIRPGFRGLEGPGTLTLQSPAGVVLGPEGLTVVPIVQFEPVLFELPDPNNPSNSLFQNVRHPVFVDPAQASVMVPASEGVITLSEDLVVAPELPEPTDWERFLDGLSVRTQRRMARLGVVSFSGLTQKTRVDLLKGGVGHVAADEVESALADFGRGLKILRVDQVGPQIMTGDPGEDPLLKDWVESLASVSPEVARIFERQTASHRQRVTERMQRSLEKVFYSRASFESTVLRALWQRRSSPTRKVQQFLARRVFDSYGQAQLYDSIATDANPLQSAGETIWIPSVQLPRLIQEKLVRLTTVEEWPWGLTSSSYRIVLAQGATVSEIEEQLSAGLEEQAQPGFEGSERLGVWARVATVGVWGPVRRRIRYYPKPERPNLWSQVYGMTRRLIRDGSIRAARNALNYGVVEALPSARGGVVDTDVLTENLKALEELYVALAKDPVLVWAHIRPSEPGFGKLVSEAIVAKRAGKPIIVEVTPQRPGSGYRRSMEDGPPSPYEALSVSEEYGGQKFVPQRIRLVEPPADQAGLEEGRGVSLTGWYFRPSGRRFLTNFQTKGELPFGFTSDDPMLQARIGRLIGRGWIRGWKSLGLLMEDIFRDSPDGEKDLRAIEAFVGKVRRLPKSDEFNEGSRVRVWDIAKRDLRKAVEFTRQSGGFRIDFSPSVYTSEITPSDYLPDISHFTPAKFSVLSSGELPGAAGLEEQGIAPAVNPWESAEEIALMGDTARPAPEVAASKYVNRPQVRAALRAAEGQLWLPPIVTQQLSRRDDAVGGLLLSREAASELFHEGLILMDSDLQNDALEALDGVTVIKAGSLPVEIFGNLSVLQATERDVLVLEPGDGLPQTATGIRNRIAQSLSRPSSLPRTIVGERGVIKGMPAAAFRAVFQRKGRPGEPNVYFIGVVYKFQDDLRREHSLIVFTQV